MNRCGTYRRLKVVSREMTLIELRNAAKNGARPFGDRIMALAILNDQQQLDRAYLEELLQASKTESFSEEIKRYLAQLLPGTHE